MKFRKELYSKIALIKAAYNFSDRAYIHLDADGDYYYVTIEPKAGDDMVSEQEFENEMLTECSPRSISTDQEYSRAFISQSNGDQCNC